MKMSSKHKTWKSRYRDLKELTNQSVIPFSGKVEIKHFVARDSVVNQEVIIKKIFVNEDSDMQDLAQYLWHYEISLNQRALNVFEGKSLIRLIDGAYDPEEKCFILVTESGGKSLRNLLLNKNDHEDIISFNGLKKSDYPKKKMWEGVLKLAEGLRSLHNAGLLHRNISLDTVYFDGNAFSEGEGHIFKLGDFNWSIYLYSISNFVSNDISREIIQNNLHFFRAPECLDVETFKSDIFSFGLVLAFLFFDFDIEKYLNSDFTKRMELFKEIREQIQFESAIDKEKEIILKAIELDPEQRFESTDEFTEAIREFVKQLSFKFTFQKKMPIYFRLDTDSHFLRGIAKKIDINIQGIRDAPNEFLIDELKNCTLYLTNNLKWPLWAMGKIGKYKFKKAYNNRNLAELAILYKNEEREFDLTDHKVCTIEKLYWLDNRKRAYSIWDQIFATSLSQIKTLDVGLSGYEREKFNWLKALRLITEAEEEIEKKKIFEYEIIEDSKEMEFEPDEKRYVIVNIYNNSEHSSFSEVLRKSQKKTVELVNNPDLRQKFKQKRKWKIHEIIDEKDDLNTIVKLQEIRKNEDPPQSGYLRFWDLYSTLYLLRRKYIIIQNLEQYSYLIDAILNPAVSHQYFLGDKDTDIVKFIFYTFPIFILQGPPGTGKTWTAKELINLSLQKDPFKRILISSKEHAALDDLLNKTFRMCQDLDINPKPILVRLISTEKEREYSPKSIAFKHFPKQIAIKMLNDISSWKPENEKYDKLVTYISEVIEEEMVAPSREWVDIIRESANLIFCTSMSVDLRELELSSPNFDLVIVEEAGKTYPSELFRPLQLGNKWVLIGDQNQLPPFRLNEIETIINKKLDLKEELNRDNIDFNESEFLEFRKLVIKELKIFQSMFERFTGISPSFNSADKRKSCDTLMDQYRLPSKIGKMISSIFYEEDFNQKISDVNDFLEEPNQFKEEQLIWINTKGDKRFKEQRKGTDICNLGEARLIRDLLKSIKVSSKYKNFKLAILTPYNEQKEILQVNLPKTLENLPDIDIRESCYTIDGFQGQEAELVIISLVRSNRKETAQAAWGFVKDPERLNVMLSRAKIKEIIIGNYNMCINHKRDRYMDKFVKVAEFIQEEGKIIGFDEMTL